ncbi:rhodanese-like domain-containing protein [Tenacibaculum discolor]|uniref:Rhodanese n=1 Tax=Tenacibaculum discolor TaxID=361581 RepID=A0A2G1BX82_9FLAO|nr:rhodanese-like domain-containing protein [Tenacibaculum discolor]MDP2540261.1 rhodanese-like domain-containing protein [Tenacibaculum discolor]PHN98205.1 rhodanese [Tenacibaculum discolor]PHO00976.1 rhodanese [Rhodobacteraceae bacterium 4F10]
MKNLIFLIFLISVNSFSQKNLQQLLKKYNTESVPYISISELQKEKEVILLDAREPKEFEVSHLKNAMCVGYDFFNLENTLVKLPKNKNTKIVVYCSLGIRSEDIAEKLQKEGFTNIFNLYGGIFEWKNQGNITVNLQNNPTEKVHAFNKEWSKWLHKGEKVYE